jgi:hypothetical protein
MTVLLELSYAVLGIPEAEPRPGRNPWRPVTPCSDPEAEECPFLEQIHQLQDRRDRKASLQALKKLIEVSASGLPISNFYDQKQCHEIHSFQYDGRTRKIWRIRQGSIRLPFYYGAQRLLLLPLVLVKRRGKLTRQELLELEEHIENYVQAENASQLTVIRS